MTDEARTEWACPRDGSAMEPMGRRSGAWRCPVCRGIFLDVETMRRGREGRPPAWLPVALSLGLSLLMTFAVRRLRRRRGTPLESSTGDPTA